MRTNFLGQTDRQTDGQTDRRTDGQTEKFNTISLRFTGDKVTLGAKLNCYTGSTGRTRAVIFAYARVDIKYLFYYILITRHTGMPTNSLVFLKLLDIMGSIHEM